jgi:hypothetical protein
VACPPEEEHTFSPTLLTLLVRRQGWDAVYLGPNVPVAHLEEAILTIRPQLVILSAQQLRTAATLFEMTELLQQEQVRVGFGGLIFNLIPSLRARIHGHFLGERLDMATQTIEQLMFAPPLSPSVEGISEAYHLALAHYRERQSLVETHVLQAAEAMDVPHNWVTYANQQLALNIVAALKLGDIAFVGTDITWIEGLMANYRLPTAMLHHYLSGYHQAAQTHLDERGSLIVGWLAELIGSDS